MAGGKSMAGRLRSLERKFKPTGTTVCPECAGPTPGQNAYAVLNGRNQPYWGVCGTCGLALDIHGQACAAYRLGRGEPRRPCKLYGAEMANLMERV